MKKMHQALAGLGLAAAMLAGQSAFAESFQFSYRFNTGELVTGSFAGTLSGDLVSDISQLAVQIDGTAMTGPLNAFRYTSPGDHCPSCFSAVGAVASFDPMKNNFYFSNGDAETGAGVTNMFYVIPWPNGGGNPVATQALFNGNTINLYNGQYVAQNWQLAVVPEPTSLALMLLGLSAVAWRRSQTRRQAD